MAEPVDPLALVIAYLRTQGNLMASVSDRIAGEHRFAMADAVDGSARGWPTPSRALTLRYNGGDGDADTLSCPDDAHHRVRLEYRCWGKSQADAAVVWGWLEHTLRWFQRVGVTLPDGRTATLFVLWSAGDGPIGETDPDLGLDYLRGSIRVHAQAYA